MTSSSLPTGPREPQTDEWRWLDTAKWQYDRVSRRLLVIDADGKSLGIAAEFVVPWFGGQLHGRPVRAARDAEVARLVDEPTVETIRAAGEVVADKMGRLAEGKYAGNVRISVPRTDGEQIVLALNARGFAVVPRSRLPVATASTGPTGPAIDDDELDEALRGYFAAREAAVASILAHRASPPEYPGLALVPVPDLDALAAHYPLRPTPPVQDREEDQKP